MQTFHSEEFGLRFDPASVDESFCAVTFELNMNRVTVKRKIYGYLEYIAELGGLAGALGSACRALIAIL